MKELEYKFRVNQSDIASLLDQLGTPVRTVELINTYWDTPDLALRKDGYVLRIRQDGSHYYQTLKKDLSNQSGLSERLEWEFPIQKNKFEWNLFPETERNMLKNMEISLQEVFKTIYSRKIWNLKSGSIEFCLDVGIIKTDSLEEPILEIELERKDDRLKTEALTEIAKQFNFTTENKSKAERGYQLFLRERQNANQSS